MKTTPQIWRDYFANWPAQFRRKGVVIPSFGEAIQFVDFVLTEDVVVLERPTPDTVGARRVALAFQSIEAVKYTEPLKTEQFLRVGFVKGAEAKNARPDSPPSPKTGPNVALGDSPAVVETTPPAAVEDSQTVVESSLAASQAQNPPAPVT